MPDPSSVRRQWPQRAGANGTATRRRPPSKPDPSSVGRPPTGVSLGRGRSGEVRRRGRTVPREQDAQQGPTGVQAGCDAEKRLTKTPPARRPAAHENERIKVSPACRPEAGGVGGGSWRVWCWFGARCRGVFGAGLNGGLESGGGNKKRQRWERMNRSSHFGT